MKRDMDFVRNLLLWIEADQKPPMPKAPPGYPEEALMEHLALMADAGLISGRRDDGGRYWAEDTQHLVPCDDGQKYFRIRLEWHGHDFLENARSDTIWNQAKKTMLERVGGASLDVMQALLAQTVRQALGLPA